MTPKKQQTGPNWGGSRPSVGRKPKPDKLIKSSVTLSPAQSKKVKALAQERGVSAVQVIRSAVDALPEPQETP